MEIKAGTSRNPSADFLRGIVVVLMALDHAQYFCSEWGLPTDGLNGYFPVYHSLFHHVTRFLSHICAPTFIFLAGMMIAWRMDRKKVFLRGLALIFLQLTIVNVAWWPAAYFPYNGYLYFDIISCLGMSMCLFAASSYFKPVIILLLSLIIFIAAPCIPHAVPNTHPWLQAVAIIFYVPSLDTAYSVRSLFTVLQWIGFMGIGYFIGTQASQENLILYKKKFCTLGLILILLFFPVRWFSHLDIALSVKNLLLHDFFNLSKYPPSHSYIVLTLGFMLVIWSALIHGEKYLNHLLCKPLLLFGQTSLFFYITHLYLYGSGAYWVGKNVGISLAVTWWIWFAGLIPMYFFCLAYRKVKIRYPNSFLKYL